MKKITLFLIVLSIVSCSKYHRIEKNCCGKVGYSAAVDSALLKVPNVFTPNGDGVNDRFQLFVKNISSLNIVVYDKKNENVWEETTAGSGGSWDGKQSGGKSKGKIIDEIYTYSIEATTTSGQIIVGEGEVTIMSKPGTYCIEDRANCLFPDSTDGEFDKNTTYCK